MFAQCHERGQYNILRDLRAEDRAKVVLICNNPFARELFELHPKRAQMEILDLGYWDPREDGAKRREHGLPEAGKRPVYAAKEAGIEWPATERDLELIAGVKEHGAFVVLAASAGLPDRSWPEETLREALRIFRKEGWPVAAVGRSYDRHGRTERRFGGADWALDMVDQLTVPGTARLVRECAGLATCHSALNLLGWFERKPQLLLYPESVRDGHVARRDQWAFGIDWPTTTHGVFGDFDERMARRFLGSVTRGRS